MHERLNTMSYYPYPNQNNLRDRDDDTIPMQPSPPAYPPQQNPAAYPQPPQQPGYPQDPAGYPQQYPPAHPQQPGYQQQPPAYPQQPYQPTYGPPPPAPQYAKPKRKRRPMGCCSCFMLVLGIGFLLVAGYFLAPLRTNMLLLGIDRAPDGTLVGRSDTIILVSVVPLRPNVSMLSIPRDLWVDIPGVGQNRINTAHFFAEANLPGSGPQAAADAIENNFDVQVPYYVRVQFDTIRFVVDALGGLTINLPTDMAGYPAGQHHLTGDQALAFARDRSGTDDFFRMANGQFLIRALAIELLKPESWPKLPDVARAAATSIDTNLPFWQWPRIGVAVLRAGPEGIDSRTIQREMVTPFTTEGGAQVLEPRWDQIDPMVDEMFH